jgi:RNA polymerase sigma factor (sigma-70 family)
MTTQSGSNPGQPDPDLADPGLTAIIGERRQLTNLAYRLLGSQVEAEDAVQETYARWYALNPAGRDAIASPGGWLTTVASRICLDQLRSARVRRERYVGQWIPEPLPEPAEWAGRRPAGPADPAERITLDESVSMAFLVVLEAMTPAERVAFILHDVFGYSFPEIAGIVGRTPAACRQLASSGRRRIRSARAPAAPPASQAAIIRDFKNAWQASDIGALIAMLDPEVTITSDGGGLASATRRPVAGAVQTARFLAGIARTPGLTILERTVNGQPGLIAQRDGSTVTVCAFEITADRVTRIWAIRNPDKLRRWAPASAAARIARHGKQSGSGRVDPRGSDSTGQEGNCR